MDQKANNRKYIRHTLFPHVIDVSLKTSAGALSAGVHDISQGGLGLLLGSFPTENSNLVVRFEFNQEIIELRGSIRWKAKPLDEPYYRVGLELLEEDHSKAQRIIEEFIAS